MRGKAEGIDVELEINIIADQIVRKLRVDEHYLSIIVCMCSPSVRADVHLGAS